MELIEQLTRQYSSGHMLAMHAQLTSVTTRVKQLQPGTWSHSLPVKNRLKANLVLPDSLNKRWETKRAKDRSQGHQRKQYCHRHRWRRLPTWWQKSSVSLQTTHLRPPIQLLRALVSNYTLLSLSPLLYPCTHTHLTSSSGAS